MRSSDPDLGKLSGVKLFEGVHFRGWVEGYFDYNFNWLGGPEQTNNNSNWRNLGDFQIMFNTPRFRTMTNIDLAHESQAIAPVTTGKPRTNADWEGVTEYLRYRSTEHFDPSLRVEWYRDPQGFTTNTAQNLMGYTFTLDYFIAGKDASGRKFVMTTPTPISFRWAARRG